MMHHLDAPLDEALDGTFSGQGILLHYDLAVFDDGIGLEMGSAWSLESLFHQHTCTKTFLGFKGQSGNPFKMDEQQTHLFLFEYQVPQRSGPAIRRGCEFGVEFGRPRSVCGRPKDLEVDEEMTNGFVARICGEFAVDLWVDKTLLDEYPNITRTRMYAFSRFPYASFISSR